MENIENRKERFRKVFDYLVNITGRGSALYFCLYFWLGILAFNREEYDKPCTL
jgi:hypothetical protein